MKNEVFEKLKQFRLNPPLEPIARLEALKKWAKVIDKSVIGDELKAKRKHFNTITLNNLFFREKRNKLICWICGVKYRPNIIHHIVTLGHGGDCNKFNLIAVCKNCHKLIHHWIAINFRNVDSDIRIDFKRDKFYDTIDGNIKKSKYQG